MEERKVYSVEEKERIVAEGKECRSYVAVAKKYEVPITTVYNWVKKLNHKDKTKSGRSMRILEKLLGDKDLEIKVLKELLKKTTLHFLKD